MLRLANERRCTTTAHRPRGAGCVAVAKKADQRAMPAHRFHGLPCYGVTMLAHPKDDARAGMLNVLRRGESAPRRVAGCRPSGRRRRGRGRLRSAFPSLAPGRARRRR